MTRIRLDHVIYDANARGFRAAAVVMTPLQNRETSCFWPGPARAEFDRVTRGLADDAIARLG